MRGEFGLLLRAQRLGYHWHSGLQCYVRISAVGDSWIVRLATTAPEMVASHIDHVCWWEMRDAEYALLLAPALRRLVGQEPKAQMLALDDAGKEAR